MNRSRLFTIGISVVLLVPFLSSVALASPSASTSSVRPLPSEVSVRTKAARSRSPQPDTERTSALRKAPSITWPTSREFNATGANVRVLDRAAARRAGLPGVIFRLTGNSAAGSRTSVSPAESRHQASTADARRPVSLNYSGFRHAYGGDWATRLSLVQLSECVLNRSSRCTRPKRIAATNDLARHTLRASLSDGLYAVTGDSSGSAGSFEPTSLAPSATWQVGLQSGDFAWSYDLDTPEMPGGSPELGLSYSSGSIDGRVASTNNQASWIGEGFDFQPGFIERSYKSCKEDGLANSGEQCWPTYDGKVVQSAHVALPGLAGELVKDDVTGTWRAEQDDGWKVELLTGAVNGDDGEPASTGRGDQGEHWRITSPDGTQYYFGLNRLPGWASGSPETRSAWTAPVYGNNAGEPCNSRTWCQQAYRWSLDYVVDRQGDATAYYYDTETNHYARGGSTVTSYVRSGQLSRIEYGFRSDEAYAASAPARVVFGSADRCLPGSSCTQASPQDWPDTPWDQACSSSACQIASPTFWSTKRLSKITTQVFVSGAYKDVESWTLNQSYPVPGDNTSPALWLESIVHTGLAGATPITMPPVRFDGAQFDNRIDATGDGIARIAKRRITNISNETGGAISVSYRATNCAAASLPTPDTNTRTCFPAYWSPGGGDPTIDWFAKYVVSRVTESDLVGGNPPEITDYEYVGGTAWAHDDSELLSDKYKTWGQWRGFQRVRVRTGNPSVGPQTLEDNLFLRGMDGDLTSSGSRRDIDIIDSTGGSIPDTAVLRGFARETITYNGDGGGPWIEKTITEPVVLPTSAIRKRAVGPLESHITDETAERTITALSDGGTRTTEKRVKFDSVGQPIQIHDLGDVALADDDTCTTISYARNASAWILDAQSRIEQVGVACGQTVAYPDDLLADVRFSFDGQPYGTDPSKGMVTRTERATGWQAGSPTYAVASQATYDDYGRPLTQMDAADNTTTTAYTPARGGPLTAVTVTNPLGHVTTTRLDPLLGEEIEEIDANGLRTETAWDGVGRTTGVWLPGRSRTTFPSTPNLAYSYVLRADAPSAVSTRVLQASGAYVTSIQLYDGQLRERQLQISSPGPVGGRIVSETLHDSYGRPAVQNSPFFTTGAVSTTLLSSSLTDIPSQTRFTYDGADREIAEILYSKGVEKWRTTRSYGGNWQAIDPPDGGTATMAIEDVHDRIVELRQFTGGAPTGTYDATTYAYDKSGALTRTTNAAGQTWSYRYDMRGRRVRAESPDTGVSTFTYDDLDRMSTSTDARNRTLTFGYDVLGRRVEQREGSTLLATWTYDTLAKGKPTSSTRFMNGSAYTQEILGYDLAGRPTGTAVSIPAVEGALAGRYQTTTTYNSVGAPVSLTLPGAGGLPEEKLMFGYSTLGWTSTMKSPLAPYVAATEYTGTGQLAGYTSGITGKQVKQSFAYDTATARLTRHRVQVDGTPSVITDLTYEYDPAGNVTRISDRPENSAADVQCFSYDYLRRLTEAWSPGDACSADPSQSVLGGPAPYWHSYRYDKSGNRTSETRHATPGDPGNVVRSYGYPAGRPHTLESVTTTGSGQDTFTYDSAGNTLTRTVGGKTQTLEWDAENHLTTLTEDGKQSSHIYSADGDRLLRKDPTGTTLYLGDTELRLQDGTVTGTRHYVHNGTMIAVRTGSTLKWLASDHHGTQQVVVDSTTMAATIRRTLPFGDTRGGPPSWPSAKGFVGGTNDPSGLVHIGAREYDTANGRFISADPITDPGDPQQLNGYAYAENNPVTFSDPDGLKTKKKATTTKSKPAATQKAKQQKAWKKQLEKIKKNAGKLKCLACEIKKLHKIDPKRPFTRAELNYLAKALRSEVDWTLGKLNDPKLSTKAKKALAASQIKSFNKTIAAIINHQKKAYGGNYLKAREAANALFSKVGEGEAGAAGGTCKPKGDMTVCTGTRLTAKGRDYTHGNVFITHLEEKDLTARLLEHESRHADQWFAFGIHMPILYNQMNKLSEKAYSILGAPQPLLGMNCKDTAACYNSLEIDAGLYKGGYYR